MDLSIIIVNWNSCAYVDSCITSVQANAPTPSHEIVVIDAGSYDGCSEMLARRHPSVRFVQATANIGFARANNRAFEESAGDVLLFLNPDTEVVGRAIDAMYACIRSSSGVGVVGCRLLNADATVQSSCVQAIPTILNQALDCEFLRSLWPRSTLWGTSALYDTDAGVREVQAISGACLMVTRAVFERVGRFSDEYFMYAEDIDLSHKVRTAGYRNYYVPHATVVHYGGSSSGQLVSVFSAVMMREALWRFLRKTRGRTYAYVYRAAMLACAVGRLVALAVAPLATRRTDAVHASRRKWHAVLLWTMCRDGLVPRYYPAPGNGTCDAE